MTKIIDKIKTEMEAATLCATCALRETCDKSATRNHWRSLNQACNEWRAWNEDSRG